MSSSFFGGGTGSSDVASFMANNFVDQDEFVTDGSTSTFTLSNDNIEGTVSVYRNGQVMTKVSSGLEDQGSFSIDNSSNPSTIVVGGSDPHSDEEVYASYYKN